MLRFAAHFLVVLALLTSPVFAGYSDVKSPADTSVVAVKADQGKANDGENKIATNHHCCTSHAHYGDSSPAYEHVSALAATNGRPPLLAVEFLAAFEPNPLLEPPSRA